MSAEDKSIGRLEGKMDLMIVMQGDLGKKVVTLHDRVDKQGKKISKLYGGVAAVGGLLVVCVAWFRAKIGI